VYWTQLAQQTVQRRALVNKAIILSVSNERLDRSLCLLLPFVWCFFFFDVSLKKCLWEVESSHAANIKCHVLEVSKLYSDMGVWSNTFSFTWLFHLIYNYLTVFSKLTEIISALIKPLYNRYFTLEQRCKWKRNHTKATGKYPLILRILEKRTLKRILVWKPIGRKIRGRPRIRWIEDMKTICR
jgi:hypothetical protein